MEIKFSLLLHHPLGSFQVFAGWRHDYHFVFILGKELNLRGSNIYQIDITCAPVSTPINFAL